MAMETIFDSVYRAYTTPLEAQQLKAQVQIKQTEAQAGLLELAQQKATMGAMQQIWGVQGLAGASAAGTDDQDRPKWMATARYLMGHGNVKEGVDVMQRVAGIDERKAQTIKDQIEAAVKRRQDLSATAGAVNDQNTYSAAFPVLMEDPNFVAMKPTGIYEQDRSKLDFLSKSGATWADKAKAAEAQSRITETAAYHDILGTLAQDRLKDAQKRTTLMGRAADRADKRETEWERENAAKDARAQAGIDLKKNPAGQYAKDLSVGKMELQAAQDTFALDPRTKDIPAAIQSKYAEMASRRAKEIIANARRKDPSADYTRSDYDDALSDAMDNMEQEGFFKPNGTNYLGTPQYTYQGGRQPAGKGSPQTPAGAPKPGDYSSIGTLDQAKAYAKAHPSEKAAVIEYARKKGWVQ